MLCHDLHGNWDVNVCGCFRFAYGNLPGDQTSLLFGQGGSSHCWLVFVRRRGNAPQTVPARLKSDNAQRSKSDDVFAVQSYEETLCKRCLHVSACFFAWPLSCMSLALLPGTCWMRVASFLWRWPTFLEGEIYFCLIVWNVIVHVLDYGASIDFTHCVKKCWCREKEFVCFWVWYNKWFDTMCEESFVAVRKYLRQQGVRSSFGRAMLSSLFCLEIMLKRATFHFYCYVKIFGDIGDLAMLVTFAWDTCVWRLL